MRVISPYTYCDADGEHIGASIQVADKDYIKVTDRCDALMNTEARGINLTGANWMSSVLCSETMWCRAKRTRRDNWLCQEHDVATVMANVIRGGVLASALSLDWYRLPKEDLFKKEVIGYLKTKLLSDNWPLMKRSVVEVGITSGSPLQSNAAPLPSTCSPHGFKPTATGTVRTAF